jgi:hypothetical protein
LDAGLLGLAGRQLCWNAGYWGPHIGFYGGVNYGFGYGGVGYEGGYWNNGVFAYNRTVNNFGGVSITNVYNKTVIVNNNVSRTSFNGGAGGTTVRPTAKSKPSRMSGMCRPRPDRSNTKRPRARTSRCLHRSITDAGDRGNLEAR